MAKESADFFKPFVEGLELEGSYALKDPCYAVTLMNPDSPKCLRGSPWSEQAQKMMGGDIEAEKATLKTIDNFHRVYTVTPVHLPQVNNTCDGTTSCTMNSITVTEALYDTLDQFDTGKYPIGASELRAKLMSRQSIQVDAGNKTSNFHEDDEVGNRCGEINQAAIDWAMSKASEKTRKRYESIGKKLVIGNDEGPYNAGPLWIWKYLAYTDNADKTQTVVQSPMMRTPTDYSISAAAGFHYCKLLSPFRALEWMHIDALYDKDNIKPSTTEALFLQ